MDKPMEGKMKRKHEIMLAKNELILDGTYRKAMSKKRWKQPNETLWMAVLVTGFFLLSGGQNLAIALISFAMMGTALYKLRGIDLEEECNSGIHFTDD